MKSQQWIILKARLHRWVVLGSLALAFIGLSSFSDLSGPAIAASLNIRPVMAASSAANQVKGQVNKIDQAVGNVKDKLDSASKDSADKAEDLAAQAKGKARKDIAKTKAGVKDLQSSASSKAKQDTSKVEGVLEKAGDKAEAFASNALDTAKNLLGQ